MTTELALPNNRSSRMWRDLLVPTATRTCCITGLIVPGLVLGALPCVAQHAPSRPLTTTRDFAQRVDAYVAPYVRLRDFGGVVLLARGGRVLVARAYGLASYELGVPVSPSMRFGIGSVTKTFTAAAIELLAERGRLSLHDPLSRFLPGLVFGDSVTLAQLLDHTAGVPDYYSFPEYAARRTEPISLEEFARLVGGKSLDFTPGSQARYSNSGYKLLAAVVERVSGMSYSMFLRTQIFEPLHLGETGDLTDGALVERLAPGYDPGFAPARVQPAAYTSHGWLEGNGAVYSTAADLLHWVEAIQSDALVHTSRLSYPYGWGKHVRFGRDVLEQNGRIPTGYTAYVGTYPKERVTIIVLGNIQSQAVFQMGPDLAALVLGERYTIPVVRAGALAPPPVDTAALRGLAGRYEVSPGFTLTVQATARGLLLAGPDGAFLPLDSEGPGRFFFRPLYVPIAFRTDAAGRTTALLWAGTQECRRIE
jgi:CubicO group peptidase (beta-lactamase class C family)